MNNHETWATCACGNEQDIRLTNTCEECGGKIELQ